MTHVAMMGGSLGVELGPDATADEERKRIPDLVILL